MIDPTEPATGASERARKYRPRRTHSESAPDPEPEALSADFLGLAAAFGNTLLFIGYEVQGLVEITVYPRNRFSSDDRVQGHLGYVRVPLGTPWADILAGVESVYRDAQSNYRVAVTRRSAELRAHGSRYETAYETITDLFRECWHAFALKLQRSGRDTKDDVTFEGSPPGPVLATLRGSPYTIEVFPTGSISVRTGDKRGEPRRRLAE